MGGPERLTNQWGDAPAQQAGRAAVLRVLGGQADTAVKCGVDRGGEPPQCEVGTGVERDPGHGHQPEQRAALVPQPLIAQRHLYLARLERGAVRPAAARRGDQPAGREEAGRAVRAVARVPAVGDPGQKGATRTCRLTVSPA